MDHSAPRPQYLSSVVHFPCHLQPLNDHGFYTVTRNRVSLLSVRTHRSPPKQTIRKRKQLTNSRTINLPFPTHRLADSALQTLEVDAELSPLVRRTFTLTALSPETPQGKKQKQEFDEIKTVLQTTFRATTNRMLRVAVNGFMESLGVVLGVMRELDVDVLKAEVGG